MTFGAPSGMPACMPTWVAPAAGEMIWSPWPTPSCSSSKGAYHGRASRWGPSRHAWQYSVLLHQRALLQCLQHAALTEYWLHLAPLQQTVFLWLPSHARRLSDVFPDLHPWQLIAYIGVKYAKTGDCLSSCNMMYRCTEGVADECCASATVAGITVVQQCGG